MPALPYPSNDTSLAKKLTLDHPAHELSVDGASNGVEGTRSKSPVNVHKALPPVPPLNSSTFKTAQSASTTTPSFAHSQDSTTRPSTASSFSSGRSRSSSKTDFRIITRGLVNPDMAGRNVTLTPMEPDMYLHPTKYDPGNPPKSPKTPPSFTSIRNANPYMNEPRSPMFMPPPLSLPKNRDPAKTDHVRGMPQSRSEPTLYGLDGQQETKPAKYHLPTHSSPISPTRSQSSASSGAAGGSRGRPVNRSNSPIKILQDVNENEVLDVQKVSRKRSRSPVKRLLGLGKSTSLKDIAGEPQAQAREEHADKAKRTGLQIWGDKFRHGFLTSEPKATLTASPKDIQNTPPPRQSKPAVSLAPPYQAKVYSEIELMICVTANKYLLRELAAGRISDESVAKVSSYWTSKNRPQVVEFQYDQATQRDLVLYNLTTLKFHGESAESPLVLNTTMYSWKTMAKEMNVRTFCAPDSQVRKHLHDGHKILEMLGSPLVTFLAFQELQLKTLAKFSEGTKKMDEKRREERRKEIEGEGETHSRKSSKEGGQLSSGRSEHARKVSGGEGHVGGMNQSTRKTSKEDSEKEVVTDTKDVTENSRGGRLGLMIRGDRYA